MFNVQRRLLAVLGSRVFWSFGLVTFLMAGLLATVNLASRYALKSYVDGQLERTPWDLTVFQVGGNDPRTPGIVDKIRKVPGVVQTETLAVLRAKLPPGSATVQVDGKPLQTPWVTLIAASSPSLLPPQLSAAAGTAGARTVRPTLGLLGPEGAMGAAFIALQGAKTFSLDVETGGQRLSAFSTPLDGGVVRLDRDELTRWLMDQTGSMTYVPPIGAVVLMPYDINALRNFDYLAQGLLPPDMKAAAGGEAPSGVDMIHSQKADYIPEVVYLARIDRDSLISGWDLPASLNRVEQLSAAVLDAVSALPHNHLSVPQGDRGATSEHEYGSPAQSDHGAGGHEHGAGEHHRDHTASVRDLAPAALGVLERVSSFLIGEAHAHEGEAPTVEADTHAKDSWVKPTGYTVDSTTLVLLQQMQTMARQIGLVSLLVALPLLWMGWMLAAHLTGLLMLNERRKLGLMRLRGVPGRTLGRSLIASIAAGGVLGGVLGIAVGSVVPLALYEGGRLPLDVLAQREQIVLLGLFLVITIALSLLVSARLVKYATSISPLEASGRYASSELTATEVKFGVLQGLALALGAIGLAGWVFGFSPTALLPVRGIANASVAFDFLSLPLFLYGICTLLASRRVLIQSLLGPLQSAIGGRLGLMARRHMAAKPHRAIAFLMIVSVMASITLYPTVGSRSFEDKATRGAAVQIGSDWRFTFNAPDLTNRNSLRGPLGAQVTTVGSAMEDVVKRVAAVQGVQSADYVVESFLPSFYLPGYGMKGVPLYLFPDAARYAANPYAESTLGVGEPFDAVIRRMGAGGVALSPAVAEFVSAETGTDVRIGADAKGNTIALPSAGVLAYLPGMPARSVTDRQGYVRARVDYLNHIFDNMAYLAATFRNPKIQSLEVFVPRTVLLVKVDDAVLRDSADVARVQGDILRVLPAVPLEVHTLPQEATKIANDMFVSLSLENMKIYLAGGIVLALISIFSIALANYMEDRRALALIRVRGTSPGQLRRLLAAMLVSPSLLGLAVGALTALVAGYGLTNYVWTLREIRSVVQLLETHLVPSQLTAAIAAFLLAMVVFAAWAFGMWSFRRSARENIREA